MLSPLLDVTTRNTSVLMVTYLAWVTDGGDSDDDGDDTFVDLSL
jgi:hypothetical protein